MIYLQSSAPLLTKEVIEVIKIIYPTGVGIVGVIIGSLITGSVNSKLKRKETELRIIEKVFNKRLKAYENVLEIVRLMRTTFPTSEIDEQHNLITYPSIMGSRESLNDFKSTFVSIVNQNSHWFDTDLTRELYFIQDYLSTLDIFIQEKSDYAIASIGVLIKQDFIDLAASVESKVLRFFDQDIYTVTTKFKRDWHKYPENITEKRLKVTLLIQHETTIKQS